MRKVAILTSGGDSPGMNATLYSFGVEAEKKGVEVLSVLNGYQGLIEKRYSELKSESLRERVYTPGTYIGSSRAPSFRIPEVREKAVNELKKEGIEALVIIGGNGSYEGGKLISKLGLPVILLPGTIDNDVNSTNYTIGFFSALEEIGSALRKIWYTANSHEQLTFVEVMGRDCSDLGVFASFSSPLVELVITQKNTPSYEELRERVKALRADKKMKGMVIVVVEKILGGGKLPSLGELTKRLEGELGFTVRGCVLGHTQRGANPTTWELFLATAFGVEAFKSFEAGEFDVAIGFDGREFYRTKVGNLSSESKGDRVDLLKS